MKPATPDDIRQKLIEQIAELQRQVASAKKTTKGAKADFRAAKDSFKNAKKAAKKLKKMLKASKSELANIAQKPKPAKAKRGAAKSAPKKTVQARAVKVAAAASVPTPQGEVAPEAPAQV